MFTNLIESQSHGKDLKRRGRFVLATTAAYGLLFFAGTIASIYAYDAQLESQATGLEVLHWVPPVEHQPEGPQPVRRMPAANNTNRNTERPTRPILYEPVSNPIKPPDQISAAPNPIPPAPRDAIVGRFTSDPPLAPGTELCTNCAGTGTAPALPIESTPPPPPVTPVKPPQIQRLATQVLTSRAISLPTPAYPPIARQIRIQGPVNVQILIDEDGKVISAEAVSGNPALTRAARDAAFRARFTPAKLNGQPVKIQGVIIYNFVLQ